MLHGYKNEIEINIKSENIRRLADELKKDSLVEQHRIKRLTGDNYQLFIMRTPINYIKNGTSHLKKSYIGNHTCSDKIFISNLMKKYNHVGVTVDLDSINVNKYTLFTDIGEKYENSVYNLRYNENTIERMSELFNDNYYNDKDMNVKHDRDFLSKIQGYVSYFAGIIDERKEEKGYPDKSEYVIFNKMTEQQFSYYQMYRNDEIIASKKNMGKKSFTSISNSRQTAMTIFNPDGHALRKNSHSKYMSVATKERISNMSKPEILAEEKKNAIAIINTCNISNITVNSPKYTSLLKVNFVLGVLEKVP